MTPLRILPRRSKALLTTAYHEAGHAVASYRLHRGFRHVTIKPDADSLGHVQYAAFHRRFQPDVEFTTRTRLRLEQCIMCALAGPEAEAHFTGRRNNVGASGDYRHVVDLADYACGSAEEVTAYVEWLRVRTASMLSQEWTWAAVERLAEALVRRETLSRREAISVIRANQLG